MAAAMIDRLAHHGHLMSFDGPSYCLRNAFMRVNSVAEPGILFGNDQEILLATTREFYLIEYSVCSAVLSFGECGAYWLWRSHSISVWCKDSNELILCSALLQPRTVDSCFPISIYVLIASIPPALPSGSVPTDDHQTPYEILQWSAAPCPLSDTCQHPKFIPFIEKHLIWLLLLCHKIWVLDIFCAIFMPYMNFFDFIPTWFLLFQ